MTSIHTDYAGPDATGDHHGLDEAAHSPTPMPGGESKEAPISVSIIDDDPAICQLTDQILTMSSQGRIRVVSTSTDGETAVARARSEHPDVVLMDIGMPGLDGIEATRAMQGISPTPHVLIYTALGYTDNVQRAIEAGAEGFVSKANDINELTERIINACSGQPQLDPGSQRQILNDLHHDRPRAKRDQARKLLGTLTPREREVTMLIGRDYSNAEIAAKLCISESTEKKTLTNAGTKLAMSRIQLAQLVALADLPDCEA